MKKLAIAVMLLAGSLSAADYSGVWNGKGGIPDAKYGSVPETAQMTLLQAGNALSGTLKINTGKPYKITSGSVKGAQLTIIVHSGNEQLTGQLSAAGSGLQGRLTTSDGTVINIVFTKQ